MADRSREICLQDIVEFYNGHHPDPNDPEVAEQIDEQFPEGMFRFETVMKGGSRKRR